MNDGDPIDDRSTRLKRLRFRAWRRGFKEADLILGGFADTHLDALDERALNEFEALLGQSDHEIYAWLTGRAPVPAEHDTALFQRLRAFDAAAAALGETSSDE